MGVLSRQIVTDLITAGLAAPSAENHHFVEFSWSGADTLSLRCRPPGALGAAGFNPRILALLGFGAMLENIVLRASQQGLGVEIEGERELPWSLELHFRASGGALGAPLAAQIGARHTNRKWYRNPGLSAAQKQVIDTIAAPLSATEQLFWLDQPGPRKGVLELIWRAESERFKSAELHRELFSAVRFDVGWDASCDQGLPPGSLEVEKLMRPGFSMMAHWPVAKALAVLGGHRMMGLRAAYLPARGAPNLAVIATTQPLEPGCLAAGRLLQRIWLQVSAYGLAMQPLAASCLLSLPGWQGVSPACASQLQLGWARLIGPAASPMILFRVGTADPVSVRTSRPALASLNIAGLS